MSSTTSATLYATPHSTPDRSSHGVPPNSAGASRSVSRSGHKLFGSPLAKQLAAACHALDQSPAQTNRKLTFQTRGPMVVTLPSPATLATSQLFSRQNAANSVHGANSRHRKSVLQEKIDNALKQCNATGCDVKIYVYLEQILTPFHANPNYIYDGGAFTNSFIRDVAIVLGIIDGEALGLDRAIFAHYFQIARTVCKKERLDLTIDRIFGLAKSAYDVLCNRDGSELKDVNPSTLDPILEESFRKELRDQGVITT